MKNDASVKPFMNFNDRPMQGHLRPFSRLENLPKKLTIWLKKHFGELALFRVSVPLLNCLRLLVGTVFCRGGDKGNFFKATLQTVDSRVIVERRSLDQEDWRKII